MFSRHRAFVSCQRHVCSLCVNVTPSERMSVASMAGENWLKRNQKGTFFPFFFPWTGIFWYDFRGVILSAHSWWSRDYFTRGTHQLCFIFFWKCFLATSVETGEKYPWQTWIQPKKPSVSLRLNFADLAAEGSGQFLRLSIDSKFKFSLLVLRVKMGHILAHSHLYDRSYNAERTGGRRTSRKQQ